MLRDQPDAILLDKRIGAELELVFYGEKGYAASLKYFLVHHQRVTDSINDYIANGMVAESFAGEPVSIAQADILLCVSRAPRVYFDIEPSYYTSFAYISEVIERSICEPNVGTDRELSRAVLPITIAVEERHRRHFIADPGTFSYLGARAPRYANEILTPPNALPPKVPSCTDVSTGMFVTVTGIPGLEGLFSEAARIGLRFYSNKPQFIPNSVKALPHVLCCANIKLHFARAGWGSIWYSLFSGVPFVATPFDSKDDPEIYFNNVCIRALGLGVVYEGQPIEELLNLGDSYKRATAAEMCRITRAYGTLDGIAFTAERIANDYIASRTIKA